jgi:hypothetical protein
MKKSIHKSVAASGLKDKPIETEATSTKATSSPKIPSRTNKE